MSNGAGAADGYSGTVAELVPSGCGVDLEQVVAAVVLKAEVKGRPASRRGVYSQGRAITGAAPIKKGRTGNRRHHAVRPDRKDKDGAVSAHGIHPTAIRAYLNI